MHEGYMRRAINLAREGRDSEFGGPFGAVIVRGDEIIAEVHNQVTGTGDLTQHAELRAIASASIKIGREGLSHCTLYTSCEPCMMCLGACYWAHFKAIYYGASAMDAKAYGFTYSDTFYAMDPTIRHREFRMYQLLRDEALKVWR